MAQINVTNLTFCYEGGYDNIFENVSFRVDTDWKLGLIGRNGKGKTTFLKLLLGKYEYQGSISTPASFDYFPYQIPEAAIGKSTCDVLEMIAPEYELWKICRELELLQTDSELLFRPYETLSHGERTKVMLAVLFSRDHYFLLIDEPINHLDMETRETVRDYLNNKKGFLLVSHDRWLLDECVDHVLVLNRSSIVIEKGNFSSWWQNKRKQDAYERTVNEKQKDEIKKLKEAARKSAVWAKKLEDSKIGFDPLKEHDRCLSTRSYIGEKSRRMQQRRKNLERREQKAIEEKEKLLKDIEEPVPLKLVPLTHYKERYIYAKDFSLSYKSSNPAQIPVKEIFHGFDMELKRGDRIVLQGKNGCGKSSLIKSILTAPGVRVLDGLPEDILTEGRIESGSLQAVNGLLVSYINQDTGRLSGTLKEYIEKSGIESTLFNTVLRQLDIERQQFDKKLEDYSEGQKKKVLIAQSLLSQAHLYIWDEPLNYIDVFSRLQIEELILNYQPTMLLIEHDKSFCERIASKRINMESYR